MAKTNRDTRRLKDAETNASSALITGQLYSAPRPLPFVFPACSLKASATKRSYLLRADRWTVVDDHTCLFLIKHTAKIDDATCGVSTLKGGVLPTELSTHYTISAALSADVNIL
jgi:hypothetical protein